MNRFAAFLVALLSVWFLAQRPVLAQGPELEAGALDAETLRHFQALLRFDTSDPPGVERPAAEYIRDVLEAEGIAVRMFATDENRPNVVARLRGSGTKPPLLGGT